MSDEIKPMTTTGFGFSPTLVRDPHNVPVVHVSELIGTGLANGVLNLTFSQVLFTPTIELDKVEIDRIIGARMRMDLHCAAALHSALGSMLAQATKPADTKAN